ncbi:signal-induced proliferation-associated 1-like protein 3 [Coregonus clupeaformis]|uniref:signal-induced proliferation-associated 1-like protein 3 n=1 Tax=Coregonus clupeaformis TaxID=59861 RepID=UPI001E1C457B|nr:signal-induced proliferation-associated 1-like protein 3 [Coregonus clupeaformis]
MIGLMLGVYSSPQGYKTTTVDKPHMLRATIRSRPSDSNQSGQQQSQDQHQSQPFQHQQQRRPNQQQHQPSLSPKLLYQPSLRPKPVYQPSLSPTPVYRRLITWQHKDNTNTDSNTIKTNNSSHSNSIKRQVDMTSQNVFGQPRVLASLRGPPSPRQTRKTTNLEEELRRLIIPDNTSEDSGRDAYCRHSLSTEISLDSGPLDYSLACSPVSDCPGLVGLEDLSASELSLTEGWDSGHIPLPDPAGSLEWSNLVNAAKAYEAQRTVEPILPSKPIKHGSEGGPAACPPNYYTPQGYNSQPALRSEVPSDLSDRLHHLEVLLRHLESNLEKERQDKMALMEEVTILRETNQRLWEESLSSNEKFCKLRLVQRGPRNDA